MGRRRAAVSAALALLAALAVVVPAATASASTAHPQVPTSATSSRARRTSTSTLRARSRTRSSRRRTPRRSRTGRCGRNPTLPTGFADVKAIGNVTEATAVAFAPDGTAFLALKTGVIKSFDYNSAHRHVRGRTTATDFADLTTT